MLDGRCVVSDGGQPVGRADTPGFRFVAHGEQLFVQIPHFGFPSLRGQCPGLGPRRRRPARPHPVIVISPDHGGVVARRAQVDPGQGIYAQFAPVDFTGFVAVIAIRFGGPVDPEAPHEAGMVVPQAPVVSPVVPPVESVVGVEQHASRPQRCRLEGFHEGPSRVRHGFPHPDVVGRATMDDVLPFVFGIGTAHRDALHPADLIFEIEVVGAREIVVVFFVVERPVVRVGNGGRGTHDFGHVLGIVEHFDLHRLVVALLPGVIWAVVVLVPVLVPGAAREGGVVGEGHDGPVSSHDPVAGIDDAGRVDDLQDIRDAARCHRFSCQVGLLFPACICVGGSLRGCRDFPAAGRRCRGWRNPGRGDPVRCKAAMHRFS